MVLTYSNEIQIRVQSEARTNLVRSIHDQGSSLRQQRTCIDDATPRSYAQPCADERDISQIENLGAVWED